MDNFVSQFLDQLEKNTLPTEEKIKSEALAIFLAYAYRNFIMANPEYAKRFRFSLNYYKDKNHLAIFYNNKKPLQFELYKGDKLKTNIDLEEFQFEIYSDSFFYGFEFEEFVLRLRKYGFYCEIFEDKKEIYGVIFDYKPKDGDWIYYGSNRC